MVQICNGTKTKGDVINESIEEYKVMYVTAKSEFNKVTSVRASCALSGIFC